MRITFLTSALDSLNQIILPPLTVALVLTSSSCGTHTEPNLNDRGIDASRGGGDRSEAFVADTLSQPHGSADWDSVAVAEGKVPDNYRDSRFLELQAIALKNGRSSPIISDIREYNLSNSKVPLPLTSNYANQLRAAVDSSLNNLGK